MAEVAGGIAMDDADVSWYRARDEGSKAMDKLSDRAKGNSCHQTRARDGWRRIRAVVAAALVGGLVTSSMAGATTKQHSGSVDVLYAGSLLQLMQTKIDPAFHKATGYTVNGVANGSTALATEIKGGTEVADVFLSASPSVNASLAGQSNGDWVSSYRVFGRSALVLGYNPSSAFAAALRKGPWYDVVDQRGFILGRTDPATDPKGVLAVTALLDEARRHHLARLGALAASKSNVYTEDSLVGELEAGQLDAGFFYAVEASASQLSTVPLAGINLDGTYTVALVNRSPHVAAARAFEAFLFGPIGRRILRQNGITPLEGARVTSSAGAATSGTPSKKSTVPSS